MLFTCWLYWWCTIQTTHYAEGCTNIHTLKPPIRWSLLNSFPFLYHRKVGVGLPVAWQRNLTVLLAGTAWSLFSILSGVTHWGAIARERERERGIYISNFVFNINLFVNWFGSYFFILIRLEGAKGREGKVWGKEVRGRGLRWSFWLLYSLFSSEEDSSSSSSSSDDVSMSAMERGEHFQYCCSSQTSM